MRSIPAEGRQYSGGGSSGLLLRALFYITAAFTGTMAFRLTLPAVAFYARGELRAPLAAISALFVAFVTLRAASSVLAGYAVERVRQLIYLPPACMALNSAVTLAFQAASSVEHCLALRAAQGALNGLSWPLIQLSLALSVPERLRGRVMSIYFASGSLAIMAGNFVYAFISEEPLGEQLELPAALFLVTALALAAAIRSSGPLVGEALRRGAARAKRDGWALLVVASSLVMALSTCYTMGELSYVFVSESLRVSEALSAVILGATGGVGLGVSYLLSWVADRVSDRLAVTVSVAMSSVAAALVAAREPWLLVAGLALAASSIKSFVPLSRKVAASAARPSLAMGLVNALSNVGTSLGQLTLGAICRGDLRAGWGGVSAFLLLSSGATAALAAALWLWGRGAKVYMARGASEYHGRHQLYRERG